MAGRLKDALMYFMPRDLRPNVRTYVVLSWLHMLFVTWPFFRDGNPAFVPGIALGFHLLVWLSYSFLYLIPGVLLALLAGRFARPGSWVQPVAFVVATSLCILFLRVDSVIHDLYRFHFNGFVLNLLMTPGGIESLGGGNDTYRSVAAVALAHVAIQALLWPASAWMHRVGMGWIGWKPVLLTLAMMMIVERAVFGFADLRNDGAILEASGTYPFYTRVTFRGAAKALGVEPASRTEKLAMDVEGGRLNYPAAPVRFAEVSQPPNIVILVAESLRWDRMTEQIMPNTWKLAQRGLHFQNHFSSGNGTREGLFGLFYGLYGSYWASFLHEKRSPLLMDRIRELDYQLDLRTSARFTYPEFDQTLFAGVPAKDLHENAGSLPPWQQDQDNTDALVDFLRHRDPKRPFMSFFFLESTHARYAFPDSAVIARPYLESVDYASMSRDSLAPRIDQLLNRYTNASHWVDRQMGRIYDELEKQGLLENTIVVVTGDHGEEFMEKGAWGHNSSFVDEQIRTPLVVWMPGAGHRTITDATTHLDIGTTLLQELGAPKDASGYSLGGNLLAAGPRPYIVSSDWQSIGVITPDMKYRIAFSNRGTGQWTPTDRNDLPVPGAKLPERLQANRQLILDAIRGCSRFASTSRG